MIRKAIHPLQPNNSFFNVRKFKHTMEGVPCFILGNAPSIDDISIHKLDDFFTLGINRIFKKDNFDPTILMWQDTELWLTERFALSKLQAVKLAKAGSDPKGRSYSFKLERGPFRFPITLDTLHGCGSTGVLAFEFAYTLGCNPIIILGCDCKYRDGKTDFYGKNKYHKPQTLVNCNRGINWIAKSNCGRKIINCSDTDILGPHISLEDAISQISPLYEGRGREHFMKRLFSKM